MAELIAQGGKPTDRWRRRLPTATTVVIGTDADAWQVPWEKWLSRRHVELLWTGQRLRVACLSSARNPLYFRGKQVQSLEMNPGDYFVIGGTTFRLSTAESAASSSDPQQIQAWTISAQELQQLPFRDAPSRLDVLTRLPDVISCASNNTELFTQLVRLLLAGISRADVVGLVNVVPQGEKPARVDILHWDRRLSVEGNFEPSHRLIVEAVTHVQDTVVHFWPIKDEARSPGKSAPGTMQPEFTLKGNFDWAFCTPLRGDACKGWGIYIAGRFAEQPGSTLLAPLGQNALRDDLKFVELVASIVGSLVQVQSLERRQSVLGRFFSPGVLRVLMQADPNADLEPRETEVTVLFCDLRGFSRRAEAETNLLALHEQVSRTLEVMTEQIFDNSGVVADFLGDAALGFWGWPLTDPEAAQKACLAALGIRRFFEARRREQPQAGFPVGIGLATGRAVAGRLGTREQGKVTVFGPVVNLASRLEGMTRILNVPILMDEATASIVRAQMAPHRARCRRLARVVPYGMDRPVVVNELLPTEAEYPELSDAHVAHHEAALDAFIAGDWQKTLTHLHQLPPQDLGADLLRGFIIQRNRTPPADWNGVIPLGSK